MALNFLERLVYREITGEIVQKNYGGTFFGYNPVTIFTIADGKQKLYFGAEMGTHDKPELGDHVMIILKRGGSLVYRKASDRIEKPDGSVEFVKGIIYHKRIVSYKVLDDRLSVQD